ncbi:MAG: hypothetical protein K2J57_00025 [Bacteroidales bacterium]|nr:hypothetical protein [Bacteroidales bacterium]
MFDKEMTLEKFFYDNRAYFDTLVWYYKGFKNEFYKKQREEIKKYYDCICSETNPRSEGRFTIDKWQLFYYGRVLFIYLCSDENEHRIGIECAFEKETFENQLGEFHIYVASWAKDSFGTYEEAIKKAFPNRGINDDKSANNRAFILIDKHKPEEQEKIISTLKDTYDKLKKIVNSKDA